MEASNVSVLAASSVDLSPRNGCRAAFDNIQFTAHDPKTTTFAYNGANELTTMTEGGVTTTYTYDDWGRTISKSDGTHSFP